MEKCWKCNGETGFRVNGIPMCVICEEDQLRELRNRAEARPLFGPEPEKASRDVELLR